MLREGTRRALLAGRRSHRFDFMGAFLPVGASLARASSGTRFDASGAQVSMGNNVARFTYDPVTLALQGLLVEPQRTNLVTRSQELETWSNGVNYAVANQATGPDGAVTAEKFFDANAGTPQLYHGVTLTQDVRYAWSIFGKRNPASVNPMDIYLLPQSTGGGVHGQTRFQLAGNGIATLDAGYTADEIGIELSAQGFYRCWVVDQAVGTGTGYHQVNLTDADGGVIGSHDPLQSVFVYGGQLEAGDRPSSYIPTAAAAVTRAADVLTLTVPNGTYTAVIERLSGVTALLGQVVSGGSYTVPTDVSPLRRVTLRRVS